MDQVKALNLRCCLCFGAYFLQVATFVNFVVVREVREPVRTSTSVLGTRQTQTQRCNGLLATMRRVLCPVKKSIYCSSSLDATQPHYIIDPSGLQRSISRYSSPHGQETCFFLRSLEGIKGLSAPYYSAETFLYRRCLYRGLVGLMRPWLE